MVQWKWALSINDIDCNVIFPARFQNLAKLWGYHLEVSGTTEVYTRHVWCCGLLAFSQIFGAYKLPFGIFLILACALGLCKAYWNTVWLSEVPHVELGLLASGLYKSQQRTLVVPRLWEVFSRKARSNLIVKHFFFFSWAPDMAGNTVLGPWPKLERD